MRKFYFLFAAVLFASISFGQSAANYTFSTVTTGSLALDRNGAATDMSTGTTTLLAGGNDDAASSVVNIGFDFLFMGVNYTQFSASSNGFMRLGATAVATTASSQTGTATGAIIAAFGGDQATVTAAGANSKVHYKLFGTAPNRVLVVEWANMKMNFTSYTTATAGDGTYQVLIYETTGIVDLKYGAMSVATTFGTGPVIGFSAGTTAGAIGSITSSTNAVTTTGTAWINNTYTAGAIANLNSAADGSRRVYSFVPASPAAPSSLSFTSVGATSMTLNWTDNASNELGYMIYRSTDGVTYTLNAQVAANATTAAQTGLTPSTLYYYKVSAFTEGATSTVSGSQSTTACAPLATGTYSVGPTGTYLNITAALSALNNGTSGAVVLELQAAYSSAAETFPLTLTNGACALVGGVTIRPETGATALSISSASTTATIDINGGSNFIIDGRAGGTGTTKQLTIANTSTSGTAVRFINEGSTNTLRYVTLTGVNSGTSSGVILFSTTTGANGNDNNTIDNCDIRDGATTPTIGVYSLGTNTSVATRNSGNTISNCNIFNFYNSTNTTTGGYGVNLSTGSTDWTITGNSFYQTASRTTFGSGATVSGINIATLSGNNFTVSNNFLGGTAPSCGGTAYTVSSTGNVIFRGIYISVDLTTASNITGNTVSNISLTPTGSASTSQGAFSILNGWVNVNNNIIGSQSATGSITFSNTGTAAQFSGIFAGSGSANGNTTISGNTIGGITITGTGTTNFRGITFQSIGITATTQYTVTNNTIGSLTTANSIQNSTNAGVLGIVGTAAQTTSLNLISGNTIANLTSTSTGTAAGVTGIASAGSTGGYYTVLNNTIRNLSALSAPTTAGTINVVGISHTAATTGGQNISRNTIYALTAATTAAQSPSVLGIYYSGPTSGTNVVERNLVYNLTNSATGASPAVQGIYAAAGLTSFQNNMVRLGTDVTTNTQVLGINDAAGTNSYYFNSAHIGGTASGALNSFAFSSSVTVNSRNFSNNIFSNLRTNSGAGKSYAVQVAGTAANPAGLTLNYNDYYVSGTGTVFGRFNSADVASLTAWRTAVGQDANSISADPLFVSATGATPNLHVSTGTPIEGVGVAITSVTNDFDGDVRSSNSPVDLGADAGNFFSYPVISFTPLTNTCATTSRTLVATITDVDGVPTSGSGLPVLYWKIGSGSYTAVTATSLGSDQYQFSFGSGVAVGDVISYYLAAQDNLGNVGTAPSLGATGFTANPPAASTVPSSPASYTIQNTLSGTYTVGAAGNYPTLTAAVTAYNNSCLGGPVTFDLIDAAYSASETFPITINANSTASTTNTLTIKPATGVTASISGAATTYLIRVLGSHVFINGSNNGSTSRDLTITNTSATTPGVLLIGSTGTTPIVNVAARNTIMVNGANTNTAVLVSDVSGAAGYFNNITLQNNSVSKAYIGFYAIATVAAGNGSGLNISNNDLSTSGANSIRLVGIYAQGVDGATIQNNLVGNIANTADVSNLTGIWLATGTVNTAVANNTIGPISGTSAGPRGIVVTSGVANAGVTIAGNTVSGLSTPSTGTATGITLSGATAGVDISGNSVSNIKNSNTLGYGSNGIWLASTSTAANTRVFNNFIWDVAAYGYTSGSGSSDNGYGMIVSAGAGYAITYNTVLLNTNQTVDGLPSALNVTSGVTAVGALDVRNNILATTQSNGTDRYAIYSGAANTVFSSINNNDYWSAGPNLGYISSNRATLADIQTGFGGNTNSKSVAPIFVSAVSPINLHLSNALGSNLCLNGAATPIAGITTDIDGDTRQVTTPDMGADEFNPTLPTFVVNNQSACFGLTVNLTAAAVTNGSAAGQTFTYFTDAACTNAVATPAAVGAGTYYIKATYTSGGCSIDQVSAVTVTINLLPTTFNVTGGGAYCTGGTGVAVGLDGSVSGVNYQLQIGGVNTGSPVAGTGSAISFGNQTVAGTYTVVATDATTNCTNTMTGSVTVSLAPLGQVNTVSNQTLCSGLTTAAVNFSTTSVTGTTTYSWTNNTPSIGLAATGTGNIPSFTATNSGTNPVTATITVTPTITTLGSGATALSINSPVTINFADRFITYTGVSVNGAGNAAVVAAGSSVSLAYNFAVAFNAATGYCPGCIVQSYVGIGGSGSTLQCENSIFDGMSGSRTLSFTAPTTPGVYYITQNGTLDFVCQPQTFPNTVTNAIASIVVGDQTSCAGPSTTFTFTINPLPTPFNVTGGGAYCSGGVGSAVGLSNSEVGVNYQLVLNGTNVGSPVSGTGSAISFGLQTAAGTYTVVATNPTTTCTNNMTGSVTVSINALPTITPTLTEPTTCATNDGGAALTLGGAAGPYTFNWTGLGSVQGQQNQTTLYTGTHSVIVTAANGCQASSSFTLIGPGGCFVCPTVAAVSTTPAAICQGGTATLRATGLADMGISYGIGFVVSATPLANPYTGTIVATVANGSLTNGGSTATATYAFNTPGAQYVYAILSPAPADPACRPFQATQINVLATPDVNAVANQTVCSGSSTAAVNFSSSVPGYTYSWTNNTTSIGLAASGTGNIPSFTATNFTNVPVTATVTVTPVNAPPALTTLTFNSTGAVQTWTVPAGVTSVKIKAWGAEGAAGFFGTNGLGGLGGYSEGDLSVTPGQQLSLYVGGAGTPSTGGSICCGGFNGGGNAMGNNVGNPRGGGGGASDVRTGAATLNDRVLVAGGGGGGCFTISNLTTPVGGAGGGLSGGNGFDGDYNGTGGTQSTGGVSADPTRWQNGDFGIGGSVVASGITVAGGGGGYYGGAAGNNAGGGSGYIGGVTNGVTNAGVRNGNGQIVIEYGSAVSVNCPGPSKTFTITVNPVPTVNTVADIAVCNGSTVSVPFTGFVPGTVYEWTNSNTAIGLAASGNGNLSFTGTNAGTAAISGTIIVTPKFTSNGVTCTGTPIAFTITINPTPTTTVSPASQVICSGSAITPINFGGGGRMYASNGGAAAGSQDGGAIMLVDKATASSTVIGTPAPGSGITGLDFTSSGTMYGIRVNGPAQLITINPTTGSIVNTIGAITLSGSPVSLTDLAIQPGTNVIYGATTSNQLVTINASTAVATLVGQPVPSGAFLSIAFAPNGTLYGLRTNQASGLITIDPTTGNQLTSTAITPSIGATGLGVDPATGLVYASECCVTLGNILYSIDPATGSVTQIGSFGGTRRVHDIAFIQSSNAQVDWVRDNTATVTGIPGSGTGNITGTLTNTTTAPITVTFTGTPVANGCTGSPVTTTVTVLPTGQVNTVSNQVVCNGDNTSAVTFATANTGGATTYSWTNSDPTIGLAASGTGNIASFAAVNTGTTPVTATITVTPTFTASLGSITNLVSNGGFESGALGAWTLAGSNSGGGCDQGFVVYSGNVNNCNYSAATCNGAPLDYTQPQGNYGVSAAFDGAGPLGREIRQQITLPASLASASLKFMNQYDVDLQSYCAGCTGTRIMEVNLLDATGSTLLTNLYNVTLSPGAKYCVPWNTQNLNVLSAITPYLGQNVTLSFKLTIPESFTGPGWIALDSVALNVVSTSCPGTPRTFTITVNPTPTVNTVSNQVVCNGSNTTAVTLSGAVAGTVYSWTNNTTSIGLAASGTGNIASFPAVNTGTTPVTATITVTPSTPGRLLYRVFQTHGGNGNTSQYGPYANNATEFDNMFNLSNSLTTVYSSGAATPGALFNWNNTGVLASYGISSPNDFFGIEAIGTFVPVETGVYSFGVDGDDAVDVTINGTVVTSYYGAHGFGGLRYGNISLVAGQTYTLRARQQEFGGGDGLYVRWKRPSQTTYSIQPEEFRGCTGTPRTFTITVNPTPTVNAVSNQVLCNGSATSAVTFTGAVAGTVYTWTNSTTSIGLAASGTGNIASFTAVNTGTAPVVATITVTPSANGCSGTPRTFTITVNPTPTVNAVSNQVVCNRSNTTAVTFSGAVTGTVFNWTNNTPSIGLAASGTGNIAAFAAVNTTQSPVIATITVTPSFTNGGVTCTGTPTSFTITVNPTPIVSATDLFNQRICISDGPVALNATPVGGTWSGIGVSGFNFIPSATAVGNFILTYTYTNQYGCTTTDTTTAKVSACDERNISLASGGAVLFPNPNGGQFNIRVNSTRFQYLQMRIYNQLGQLISTKQWSGLVYGQILPVDMNHLPAAVYTVRIIYDGGNLYEDRGYKMIIQH